MSLVQAATDLANSAASLDTPAEVLAALDSALQYDGLHAVLACWLPRRHSRADEYQSGVTVFTHGEDGAKFFQDWLVIRRVSSVSSFARSSVAPVTLWEAIRQIDAREKERWVIEFYEQHGMRDALYCHYHPWITILGAPEILKLTEPARYQIGSIVQIATARLHALTPSTRMRARRRAGNQMLPSRRELAMLQYRANGLTSAEIATEHGIAVASVETHLQRAKLKLNARSIAHAVLEAYRERLID